MGMRESKPRRGKPDRVVCYLRRYLVLWAVALLSACGEDPVEPSSDPDPDPVSLPDIDGPRMVLVGESMAFTSGQPDASWSVEPADLATVDGSGLEVSVGGAMPGRGRLVAVNDAGADTVDLWVLSSHEGLLELLTRCPEPFEAEFSDAVASVELLPGGGLTSSECDEPGSSGKADYFVNHVRQFVLALSRFRFSEELPWTASRLVDWFDSNVHRIVLDRSHGFGFCCRENGGIVIGAQQPAFDDTPAHLRLLAGYGAISMMAHEARHLAYYPHTCGYGDRTLAELGAHAVEFYLGRALGTRAVGAVVPPPLGATFHAQGRNALPRFCEQPPLFEPVLTASASNVQVDGSVSEEEWAGGGTMTLPAQPLEAVGETRVRVASSADSVYFALELLGAEAGAVSWRVDFTETPDGLGNFGPYPAGSQRVAVDFGEPIRDQFYRGTQGEYADDVADGGTSDISGALRIDGAGSHAEFALPRRSADDEHDFSLPDHGYLGVTVRIWAQDGQVHLPDMAFLMHVPD